MEGGGGGGGGISIMNKVMMTGRPCVCQTPDPGSRFVIQKQLKSSADIFL